MVQFLTVKLYFFSVRDRSTVIVLTFTVRIAASPTVVEARTIFRCAQVPTTRQCHEASQKRHVSAQNIFGCEKADNPPLIFEGFYLTLETYCDQEAAAARCEIQLIHPSIGIESR